MSYFGPLLNQRLIDLDADQKEDKYRAGCDTDSAFWLAAEELEEAIQAKLAEQEISLPAKGQESYRSPLGSPFGRYTPQPLAFGVPDSERIYGSGYLARHPEIQYVDVIAPDGTLEIWPEERT